MEDGGGGGKEDGGGSKEAGGGEAPAKKKHRLKCEHTGGRPGTARRSAPMRRTLAWQVQSVAEAESYGALPRSRPTSRRGRSIGLGTRWWGLGRLPASDLWLCPPSGSEAAAFARQSR